MTQFQEEFLAIQSFLEEAGELALKAQKVIKAMYKDGNQALTETDLAISKLAHQRLSPWLKQKGHVLLDEESIDGVGDPNEVFANNDYLWVLDPIDGTAGYALGRRMWGISLGLIYKGKPLLGGIYLPAIGELLLADSTRVWRIQNPFIAQAKESEIQCQDMKIHSQIFVESYFGILETWDSNKFGNNFWLNTPESAVQGFYSALVGQAAGATMRFSIWDVAAALVMAKRGGFVVRSLTDGRVWDCLQASDFKNNWKLADAWLLCADSNYEHISKGIKGEI